MNDDSAADHATHAVYLWQGFMERGSLVRNEADNHSGEIGAVHFVVGFAEIVHESCEAAYLAQDETFPGVYEYEVTEPMGTWLRDNPRATPEEFKAELAKVEKRFLEQ